jgi:predicted amidohydrolase
MSADRLSIAAWACAPGPDLRANALAIAAGIDAAAEAGVRCLLTPEAALVGSPGRGRESLDELDWEAVGGLEDELAERALERGVALVLGTVGSDGHGLGNEALVCGAIDGECRYRARCLTESDRRWFAPGPAAVVFTCDGWHLGIAIAYDLRFPAHWTDLAVAGVDAVLLLGDLGGRDDADIRRQVLPALCSARAAEWVTPVLLANTSAPDRWLDSGWWDGRGSPCARSAEGLLQAQLEPREHLPVFYRDLHRQAQAGIGRERRRRTAIIASR